ncbi:hypothetical protein F4604DRAFT_1674904 [Suillus subluteus]|nr:hypothetical protein F4604DRAFT_1674904 [Suillus subluteus]
MTKVIESLAVPQVKGSPIEASCNRADTNTLIEETMQALHSVVQAGYHVLYICMSPCWATDTFGIGCIPLLDDWPLALSARKHAVNSYVQHKSDKDIMSRFEEAVKKKGARTAQIALAWSMTQDIITALIIGTMSLKNLQDLIDVLVSYFQQSMMCMYQEELAHEGDNGVSRVGDNGADNTSKVTRSKSNSELSSLGIGLLGFGKNMNVEVLDVLLKEELGHGNGKRAARAGLDLALRVSENLCRCGTYKPNGRAIGYQEGGLEGCVLKPLAFGGVQCFCLQLSVVEPNLKPDAQDPDALVLGSTSTDDIDVRGVVKLP